MPVKIKTAYDTVEEIPEGFGELYAERNGKFELIGVDGIKTQSDIDKLQEAARKEREAHKQTREKLAMFADIDPVELPKKLEELAEAQAQLATLTAEGRVDEEKVAARIEAAVNRAVGPVSRDKEALARQVEAQKKIVAEKDAAVVALENSIKQDKIRTALRDAAVAAKVVGPAINDAVLVGETMFEFVDGKLVTKSDAGVTPGLMPKDWIKEMEESRPHWFPLSQGGGARGGGGGVTTGKENPWSVEGWNVTGQGKVVREQGEAKAAEMAARVGSKLGAVRPTKTA